MSSLLIRAQIEGMLPAMSLDELRVLREICTRVNGARESYGPLELSTDRRDWRRERANELFDAMFYECALALKASS